MIFFSNSAPQIGGPHRHSFNRDGETRVCSDILTLGTYPMKIKPEYVPRGLGETLSASWRDFFTILRAAHPILSNSIQFHPIPSGILVDSPTQNSMGFFHGEVGLSQRLAPWMIPSGKRLHDHGKIQPFFIGKSTISTGQFSSSLCHSHYQVGYIPWSSHSSPLLTLLNHEKSPFIVVNHHYTMNYVRGYY